MQAGLLEVVAQPQPTVIAERLKSEQSRSKPMECLGGGSSKGMLTTVDWVGRRGMVERKGSLICPDY